MNMSIKFITHQGTASILPIPSKEHLLLVELVLTVRRYSDDANEYRHVQLPKDMIKRIPKDYFDPSKGTLKLLWDEEWRSLGITQVSSLWLFAQDRCDLTILALRA